MYQQIPVHSLIKLIKLTHNLATACLAVQKNKHRVIVNIGLIYVVPVHPVCRSSIFKRHFYLPCSATMLLRRWQKSNFSTSLGKNPSGWQERSEELERWSPFPPRRHLPPPPSLSLYFRVHIFPEKYSCCTFVWLCMREIHFEGLNGLFLYISSDFSTGFNMNGFASKWERI